MNDESLEIENLAVVSDTELLESINEQIQITNIKLSETQTTMNTILVLLVLVFCYEFIRRLLRGK